MGARTATQENFQGGNRRNTTLALKTANYLF